MKGDRVFVDTNIIVYAHDNSAGQKHNVARNILLNLWEARQGILSTQVLQEFFYIITKKITHPLNVQSARELIGFFLKWDIIINNGDSILEAIDIHQKYKLSFWDSMIIESAIRGNANLLLSEDLSDGLAIEDVIIKNPFI